jgi:predicted phage terminase large subunit-like protein
VFWPAWCWTWQPWSRWLTSSYDARLAVRDAVRTRRLMQSEWYQQRWGRAFRFASDQNVKSYYANDRTGWRLATSMAGGVTGEHAQFIVVDDPHNVREAESDLEREAVLTTWREVFPSRRLPGGVRVVVGQRVHEEDLTADWLERERDRIHHLELPMEYDAEHVRPSQLEPCSLDGQLHDPRSEPGELLAPSRFGADVIARLKIDLGPYAYAAQYEQTPSPRAGMVLNPAWLVDRPSDFDLEACDVVQAWDLNYSEKDSSDWTVAVTVAVDRNPQLPMIHILDVYAEHLGEERHDTALAEYIDIWQPLLVGIEKRAYEHQGATRDLVRNIMARIEHKRCHIEPVEADADKIARAMIITGRAKAGHITTDRKASWWHALSNEMARFPRSAHDDRIDALAYVVRLAVERLAKVRAMLIITSEAVPVRHKGVLVGGTGNRRY